MYAYMLWADTTATKLKMRNGANSAWIEVGTLDQVGLNIVASKFPNVTTNVTLTSAQINDAVYLPSGTKMVFFQASAPTGWTQDTTNHNDKALRVVSGAGGGNGGSTGFSSAFPAQSITSSSTEAPTIAHTHSFTAQQHVGTYTTGGNPPDEKSETSSGTTGSTGVVSGSAAAKHNHTVAVAGGAPKYIDVIVCEKD
jgi:hypothetical protein